MGVRRVGVRKVGALRVGGPKFRAFFPCPAGNFILSSLSGLEFSGCRVKPLRPRSRRGFTRQPQKPKRAHLRVPVFKTPPKFNEKTPREGRKERILRRNREKKSEILGGPGEGPGEGRSWKGGPGKGGPGKGGPGKP